MAKNHESDTARIVAYALEQFDTHKRDADEQLRGDSYVQASSKRGEAWRAAQDAAAEAGRPYRLALDALTDEHAGGYSPGSEVACQCEALRWAILDAERQALRDHGFAPGVPTNTEAGGDGDTPGRTMSGEARAVAVLYQHPEWSDGKIADQAAVNRTSLYRMQKFLKAKKTLREGANLSRGSKVDGRIEGEAGD